MTITKQVKRPKRNHASSWNYNMTLTYSLQDGAPYRIPKHVRKGEEETESGIINYEKYNKI